MLARFASRDPSYDRENRFLDEDFETLRAAEYLPWPLPSAFDCAGMTLAEVCRGQRRLAYHAPATGSDSFRQHSPHGRSKKQRRRPGGCRRGVPPAPAEAETTSGQPSRCRGYKWYSCYGGARKLTA